MVRKTEETALSQEEVGQVAEAIEVAVVVLKGKTVKHSGNTYESTNRLEVSESDAARLEKLGFVVRQDALVTAAAEKSAPAVSVTVADGASISKG
ncbi:MULTISPECIES: hypothetical protein [Brenneria]|uniref:Uncharacterized protein n=1 Tax=Brenneria nigrifluens DSM 30175 = ATCC 13028 TaxID=1121120 RepID=A0A2U1UBJ8_9GAMM|nr:MULTISPECIES: hypothetical protein [Brenneria]EHD21318.1 hypothetical protein BrE312_1929 [Brenneria sp. EniD312]PWC19056.1 hypothetical protein DDT54_22605 [Brenneria nigrifluens DSM 30175 = ATCC 13028]QCR04452.1 hypothetical protein EH206_09865 [Brenneria nigrifluens DSM 30175 = ATCC 13028]